MKKRILSLLLCCLILTGCGTRNDSIESVNGTEPTTFGNAVLPENTGEAEVISVADETGQTAVGYIWRVQPHEMDLDVSFTRSLQADWEGGFWLLDSRGTDTLSLHGIHCDENGAILSETKLPIVLDQEHSGGEMVAYGADCIWYNSTTVLKQGGGDQPGESEIYVNGCDLSGTLLFSVSLQELTGQEGVYITAVLSCGDSCLISTERQVFALDRDGTVLWHAETECYIDTLTKDAAGNVYIRTDFDECALLPIDMESHTIGESVYTLGDFVYSMPGVLGYDLLVYESNGAPQISGVMLETGEKTPLWDCGTLGMEFVEAVVETGGGTLLVNYSSLMSSWALGQLVQTPVYEGQEIISLTLGTCGELSATAEAAVAMFNSLYPECYLQVASYASAEDMNLAILSGEGPDIICLSGLSQEDYARNGQLLNLYDLMAQDETVSKEDLVAEYRAEYEVDGGLYWIAPVFTYGYLMCEPQYVTGGTFEGLLRSARERPDDTFVWGMPSENVLKLMLGYCMTSFVDFDGGTCNFESAEFQAMLELCSMGHTMTEADQGTPVLLNFAEAGTGDQVQSACGFPACGVLVTVPEDSFGVYTGTKHAEAAYRFISLLLSEDIQRAYSDWTMGCPVLDSLYQELVSNSLQSYISRAKGHSVAASPVYEIVMEEAAGYFSGSLTAQQASEHIQNRVKIYLAEQQ